MRDLEKPTLRAKFQVAEGIVVDGTGTVEDMERMIRDLVKVGDRAVTGIAILLATVRQQRYIGDPGGWVAWATGVLGCAPAHAHHLRAVGDLMVRESSNKIIFGKLAALEYRKLLALSRLSQGQLRGLADTLDLSRKSRGEVESMVARLLGDGTEKEPQAAVGDGKEPGAGAAVQLDFFAALDGMAALTWSNDDEAEQAARAAGADKVVRVARNGMWMLEALAKSGALEMSDEERRKYADACRELADLLES